MNQPTQYSTPSNTRTMSLKQLNVKIPEQELRILEAFAEKTERTKTDIIREFIRSLQAKIWWQLLVIYSLLQANTRSQLLVIYIRSIFTSRSSESLYFVYFLDCNSKIWICSAKEPGLFHSGMPVMRVGFADRLFVRIDAHLPKLS